MGTRTVRLDAASEETLSNLRRRTGLSISEVMRKALRAFTTELDADVRRRPYEVYESLGLPREGEYAVAPARRAGGGAGGHPQEARPMILVDTGPLVALFDANDRDHENCRRVLDTLDEQLATTIPVLTEAFHLLRPTKHRILGLMDFVRHGGVGVLPLNDRLLRRCFELMMQYADLPMDFAEASIVAAAEHSGTERVFTLDRRDFTTCRIRRGYHQVPFTIIGDASGPRIVREGAAATEVAPGVSPLAE